MKKDKEYLDFMMNKLEPLGLIRSKAMFGGHGIFHEDTMFAIISDSVLYFKVNQENRDEYVEIGSKPFPHGISYWDVPPEILEDNIRLHQWAGKSIAIAHGLADKKRDKK